MWWQHLPFITITDPKQTCLHWPEVAHVSLAYHSALESRLLCGTSRTASASLSRQGGNTEWFVDGYSECVQFRVLRTVLIARAAYEVLEEFAAGDLGSTGLCCSHACMHIGLSVCMYVCIHMHKSHTQKRILTRFV